MMTAFIIAVRGTVAEAALLRLAATVGSLGSWFDRHAFRQPIGWRRCGTVFPDAIGLLDHRYRSLDARADLARATAAARRSGQHAHHHDHSQHQPHRDAHQLALADEIRRRFASGNVTTGQIVMFELSGGLIPCSAAIAVLVLCLQVSQIWLGVGLVLCFSIGLAITLIAAGVMRQ